MHCEDARPLLLDAQRGRLAAVAEAALGAHLAGCPTCATEDQAERLLTEALEHDLPQYPAPRPLKRRLAAAWPSPVTTAPARWHDRLRSFAPALAAAALVLVTVPFLASIADVWRARSATVLVAEAVNDHVRVLVSQQPLEVASGGMHQVKPWFEGRLDFAPVIAFGGDADFPLQGGAVGWFVDRKAATFVFKRRLQLISLFVFACDGLPWPARGGGRMGSAEIYPSTLRGFTVLLWRVGDLGYALVSDIDAAELRSFAERLIDPA
jgi:anti-sigma factor RsiW